MTSKTIRDLTKSLADHITAQNRTISTAESCTGGAIAKEFTRHSGSSLWYLGSVVAYSNECKTNILNVPSKLIQKHGAVSEEVASAMAQGVAKAVNSNMAIATTGITGPTGGTKTKPIGTVCIAWLSDNKVSTSTKCFSGNRSQVRMQASKYAIEQLILDIDIKNS